MSVAADFLLHRVVPSFFEELPFQAFDDGSEGLQLIAALPFFGPIPFAPVEGFPITPISDVLIQVDPQASASSMPCAVYATSTFMYRLFGGP